MKKENKQQPTQQPTQPTPTNRVPIVKQIVIETPKGDNKTKHNLINNVRELLNIYTKLSVQNIGFICGLDKGDNSDMCYNIDVIKYDEDIMKLYKELKDVKELELIFETSQTLYFKLK